MPLLCKLGVIERLIGVFEIRAAVLPVGVQEERVEPSIEIVMMCDVASRPRPWIELAQAAAQIAQQRLRSRPVGDLGSLAACDGEDVGDGAFLDHERTVHVGFAELKLGIEENSPFSIAGCKSHRNRPAGPVAERKNRAARGRNSECSPPDKGLKQKMKQPIHRPPPSPSQSGVTGCALPMLTHLTRWAQKCSRLGI